MSDKVWKAKEREVAAIIGGKRLLFAGAAGDAESEFCVADVKRRRVYTMGQARDDLDRLAANSSPHKLPIVVHYDVPGRGRSARPLVVMRLADFRDWYGKG